MYSHLILVFCLLIKAAMIIPNPKVTNILKNCMKALDNPSSTPGHDLQQPIFIPIPHINFCNCFTQDR